MVDDSMDCRLCLEMSRVKLSKTLDGLRKCFRRIRGHYEQLLRARGAIKTSW